MSDAPATAWLIAGAGGMLGTALQRVLDQAEVPYSAPGEGSFDITDEAAVLPHVREFANALPEGTRGVLMNAAAYTNVERAEDDPDTAYRVNEHGAELLARAARETGLSFVHVSTDFVFDGTKDGAYTEDDVPNPLSVYGASKLAGELAVVAACPEALIVRTAWVFGENGVNFPTKILAAAREGRVSLSVVTDEVGSPTYTVDLARGIVGLVDADVRGLFHLAGSGACSRFELAEEVVRAAGLQTEVVPVTSDAFPTRAARPSNSVLDCSRAASLGVTMPTWRDSVQRFVRVLEL